MRGLQIAEQRLGIRELCERLGVDESIIRAWQPGLAEMPDKDFLRFIDLLTEIEPGWLSKRKP